MTELANSGDTEDPGISDFPATSELKAMLAELLESAKKDILSNVQESIDQIYADFEYVESETEGVQAQGNPEANTNTAVASEIDNFIQSKPSELGEGSSSDSFKSLAEEFSVAEKTAPAIDSNLAEIVKSLLLEKLPKDKLEEVQNKSLRPENCTNLVAPKINKQIWQQLCQGQGTTTQLSRRHSHCCCQVYMLHSRHVMVQVGSRRMFLQIGRASCRERV